MKFFSPKIAVAILVASLLFTGSVRADTVNLLSLQSGHSVLINTQNLTRIAVGDGRIAGVVPVGTSQIVVNGKAPGHTTIFVWAHGQRTTYEVTVTEQQLDDLAQMLRSSITEPDVQVVSFNHSIVIRGTVSDGVRFQQIADIASRFEPMVKASKATLVNAVTITQSLGGFQKTIANIPGASDIRVDADGKGNVIVSGNATDGVTAQAILDRARGLAGPYLSIDGKLIDRLNSISTSQIDIKVYVLEIDKSAASTLGLQLQSGVPVQGEAGVYQLFPPSFPLLELPGGIGKALTSGPFYRTTILAPTINLLMQESHARLLSSPDLVTNPGSEATFLVGGQIPVVTSSGLGQVNVVYKDFGVKLDVTPTILGNGSVEAKIAPEVSDLDFQNAVVVSGFLIPALKTSRLSTDVITRPGESIIMGGMVRRIENRVIQKIPLLGDLPILGRLFRSTAYQNSQTDVIFVMTPEIITR